MAGLVRCQLYQALSYANLRFGIGMGCCHMDGGYTSCSGDVDFCEKPKTLMQHVIDHVERDITQDD